MSAQKNKNVIIIAGPTASGKSNLAIDIAEEFSGIVINADSMQIYKGLEIITSSPNSAIKKRVIHKLYNVREPKKPCAAGVWQKLATKEICRAHDKDVLPIVVGGTGLYLRTLIEGIANLPKIPIEIQNTVRNRMLKEGSKKLHQELSKLDPKTASTLNVADIQRICRALEVFLTTGQSLTDLQRDNEFGASPKGAFKFVKLLLMPTRPLLYKTCDARFQSMLNCGVLEEVRSLMDQKLAPSLPAMKALGIPFLIRHLEGKISIEDACSAGQLATRHYVKRQATWYKNQFVADFAINLQYSESLRQQFFSYISKTIVDQTHAND